MTLRSGMVDDLQQALAERDFSHDARQRAAFLQHRQHARRARFHQSFRHFLPHAFGHQGIDFAVLHHPAHQLHGGRCHRKSMKTGGKAGQAQDAHGVFAERVGDVAEDFVLDILHTAERVGQGAILGLCDGVDGQIAPHQVVFQGDVGRRVEDKAPVAGRRLAFRAGQGVFFLRLRVQEDGEILADGPEALAQHILGRGADDDMVVVFHGQAQQLVAHRATDRVNLHGELLFNRVIPRRAWARLPSPPALP